MVFLRQILSNRKLIPTFSNIVSRQFAGAVSKKMEEHGVVPDVIDVAPAANIEVFIYLFLYFFILHNLKPLPGVI